MKKILVPCDFSAPSQNALKFAINLAAKTQGEIIVMHTIILSAMYDPVFLGEAPLAYDSAFMKEIKEDIKRRYEKMTHSLETKDVLINLKITQGNIISAVRHEYDHNKIDLIVMGTSGTSGFEEVFIGSNTEKVIRHSPVPVFALRSTHQLDAIKEILVPTTLSLNQSELMNKIKELQFFFKATLKFLLINSPLNFKSDQEANELFESFVDYYGLKKYTFDFKNYYSEEEGIVEFAKDNEVDLILMATHARKGLSHLYHGSITENLVNHNRLPVWTYRLKD